MSNGKLLQTTNLDYGNIYAMMDNNNNDNSNSNSNGYNISEYLLSGYNM